MAGKYEFDFSRFDEHKIIGVHTPQQLVEYADAFISAYPSAGNLETVKNLQDCAKTGKMTDSQHNYLARLVKFFTPAGKQYEADFWAWYNSRPDIQEIYTWALSTDDNGSIWLQNPITNEWIRKGENGWDTEWEKKPLNSTMFWRVCGDWNVRKFIAVNRDTVYEEGDLVVLRTPFIGNWDYDPLWDRMNMPDKTVMRLGTILQMTDNVHRNSRAGKGSRAVNVLWNGTSEGKLVPERVLKHLERKRRTKKSV